MMHFHICDQFPPGLRSKFRSVPSSLTSTSTQCSLNASKSNSQNSQTVRTRRSASLTVLHIRRRRPLRPPIFNNFVGDGGDISYIRPWCHILLMWFMFLTTSVLHPVRHNKRETSHKCNCVCVGKYPPPPQHVFFWKLRTKISESNSFSTWFFYVR